MADPFSALAEIVIGIYKAKALQKWVSLLFQISVSVIGTFLFICGTSLVSTKSWPISVGSGMISAACILIFYTRRNPLLKGMMFTFPQEEAQVEIQTNIQTIERK